MTRIGIAGAGSIAFGSACLLVQSGHDVTIWSPSGEGAAMLHDAPLQAEGAIAGRFPVTVAAEARDLARADVVMIALPAYGFETVLDALAPHIRPGQPVIISSHISFAALYLNRVLTARGVVAPIIAWGTTVVTGRRKSGDRVRVNTVRNQVDICALPAAEGPAALQLCQSLFGDRFRLRDGLLAISLSNLNPQNHMGIALCNLTRMEHGENWSQGANVTPAVGRLLEALDKERLAIAAAFGVEVRTIFDHFHLSFHVPRASVSDMNQQMHAQGTGGTGPATADSRYVTEDVPFGLYMTEVLGGITGCATPLHSSGVTVFSALYGRDFRAENGLIDSLDIKSLDAGALETLCRDGYPNP